MFLIFITIPGQGNILDLSSSIHDLNKGWSMWFLSFTAMELWGFAPVQTTYSTKSKRGGGVGVETGQAAIN